MFLFRLCSCFCFCFVSVSVSVSVSFLFLFQFKQLASGDLVIIVMRRRDKLSPVCEIASAATVKETNRDLLRSKLQESRHAALDAYLDGAESFDLTLQISRPSGESRRVNDCQPESWAGEPKCPRDSSGLRVIACYA